MRIFIWAFALVFVVPCTLPVAIWMALNGHVTPWTLSLTGLMFCVSGLGITLGYHRLATHRAFQTHAWLKKVLLIAGSFAMQGGPASWASLHIQHHSHADKAQDPHTPQKGFWYSHCGWLFFDYKPNFLRYGKWLLKDKDVMHVSKYYLFYSHLGLLIPFLLDGWVGLFWAGFLRIFLTSHLTWSVNSLCHAFGKRDYVNTPDHSTNHFLIALFTFGEGWHNNHHRFLQMPFLGHHWYQMDIGKWFILTFKRLGWAWDLKIPAEFKR